MSSDRAQASPVIDENAERMAGMVRAFWMSQIVGTFARLAIPDRLTDGPLAAGELARLIACHPRATYRLMRAAKELRLVVATPDDRFSLTALGEILRSNVQGSMRDAAIALTAPGHWLPWGRLCEAVRTGRCQTTETLGAELFQYYSENPSEGGSFTGAMSVSSAKVADEVARVLDTSSAKLVVDLGGASGTLISALLAKNPQLAGTILERPNVVLHAKTAVAERDLSARCRVISGDFFVTVPEADIYLLKHIIHDWDDEQSALILSNCARALRPRGRLVLIEHSMPEDDHASPVSLVDLNMLVLLPGRERTVREYADLLARVGLHLNRVIGIAPPLILMEASAA